MQIQGSVALVTGANRGLGAAFARGLLAAGAATADDGTRSVHAGLTAEPPMYLGMVG